MRYLLKAGVICAVVLAVAAPASWAAPAEGKSLRTALLLSLAVPGAGEAYMGAGGRATMFMVSEAAVWTAYAAFRVQGGMRQDSYKRMANLFAGVEGPRDDRFYALLTYYPSSVDYNIDVLRDARQRYADDRAAQLAYFQANGYFGSNAWEWQSLQRMDEFVNTRTLSRKSYRRAVLTTGFAALTRMVSMIDVYVSFRQGQVGGAHSGIGLGIEPAPYQGMRFFVRAPF
jgi:hypothetical protein